MLGLALSTSEILQRLRHLRKRLAGMSLILAFFTHMLVDDEKHLLPQSLLGRYRGERNTTLLVAFAFALSVVPFFGVTTVFVSYTGGNAYNSSLRSVLWIACLFLGWSRRFVTRSGRSETQPT